MPVIKIVSLYAESHLPKKGWLQGCIMCEIITSHTRLAKVINKPSKTYEIHTYICPHCCRKLNKEEYHTKYIKIIDNMLENELSISVV